MLMDVEGRQARAHTGKSKGVLTAANNPQNKLKGSPAGLIPVENHDGLRNAETGRKHVPVGLLMVGGGTVVRPANHQGGLVDGFSSQPPEKHGKRPIVMVHALPGELAKRAAGKYGLKKVKQPVRDSVQLGNQPTLAAAAAAASCPEEAAKAGTSAVSVGRKPWDRNESCEERARKYIETIVKSSPQVNSEAQKALEVGGGQLLHLETKLRRQQRSSERTASAVRPDGTSCDPPRRNIDSLGQPSGFAAPAPFALTSTDPIKFHPAKKRIIEPRKEDRVHVGKRMVYCDASGMDHPSPSPAPNASGEGAMTHRPMTAPQESPSQVGGGRMKVPFDTVATNPAYPEPPSIGGHFKMTPGRRHVDPVHHYDEDVDTKRTKMAAYRAAIHPEFQMPDFVFGNPPPPAAKKPPTEHPAARTNISFYTSDADVRGGTIDNRPLTARTRHSHIKYAPTALW